MTNAFIRKLNELSRLDPGDAPALEAAMRPLPIVKAGTNFGNGGNDVGAVRILLDGIAFRYGLTREGGRQISACLLPGDFCDLTDAFLHPLDQDVMAVTKCQFAVVSRSALLALAKTRPAIMHAMWMCTARDEALLREWLTRVARREASQRLAHLFCEMHIRIKALEHPPTPGQFRLPMSQTTIADMLGLSVVHTNRSFRELRNLGLLTFRSGIAKIPDPGRLQKYADFNPAYLATDQLMDGDGNDFGKRFGAGDRRLN